MCALLLPGLTLAAPDYFPYCVSALEQSEFAALREHLSSAPIQQVDRCMRLTNSEFLVTANRQGPFKGSASNLFYCNLKAPKAASCIEDEGASYYPELSLVRQFSGPRGKQYVLWSTSLLRHGIESSSYHIFQLAAKSSAPRGYVFYPLGIGTHLTDESCEDSSTDQSGTKVTGVAIRSEGTEAVTLDFGRETCQKNSDTRDTVSFVLRDGRFQKE